MNVGKTWSIAIVFLPEFPHTPRKPSAMVDGPVCRPPARAQEGAGTGSQYLESQLNPRYDLKSICPHHHMMLLQIIRG